MKKSRGVGVNATSQAYHARKMAGMLPTASKRPIGIWLIPIINENVVFMVIPLFQFRFDYPKKCGKFELIDGNWCYFHIDREK